MIFQHCNLETRLAVGVIYLRLGFYYSWPKHLYENVLLCEKHKKTHRKYSLNPVRLTEKYVSVAQMCLSLFDHSFQSWWRHQMETFSALLAICAGNSPVTGEFPTQRPVTRSFDVFFDLRPNKRLSKQTWGWWFETPSRPSWRHCNDDSWASSICYGIISDDDELIYAVLNVLF